MSIAKNPLSPIRGHAARPFSPSIQRSIGSPADKRGSFGGFGGKPLINMAELNAFSPLKFGSTENNIQPQQQMVEKTNNLTDQAKELARSTSCVHLKVAPAEQGTKNKKSLGRTKRPRLSKKKSKNLQVSTEILEPLSPNALSPQHGKAAASRHAMALPPIEFPSLTESTSTPAFLESNKPEEKPALTPRRKHRKKSQRTSKRASHDYREVQRGENPLSDIVTDDASTSSSSSAEPSQEAKDLKQRYTIVQELVSTERNYLKNLSFLKEIWAPQLQKLLPEALFKDIFSPLQPIIGLTLLLLPKLEERLAEFDRKPYISDIFQEVIPGFQLYTNHLQNHATSSAQLREILTTHKSEYDVICKTAYELTKSLDPLESYLILPVQRLPRYKMLFEAMMKVTPREVDPGLAAIRDALSKITAGINHTMNESANRLALFNLAHRFQECDRDFLLGVLMNGCPELIKQGEVKTEDVEFPEASLFLLSDSLIIGHPLKKAALKSGQPLLQLRWSFPLETLFIRDHGEQSGLDRKVFHLVNPTSTVTVIAATEKEAGKWKQAIEAAIQMLLKVAEEAPVHDPQNEEGYLVLNVRTQGPSNERRAHELQQRRKDIVVKFENGEWKASERIAPSLGQTVSQEQWEDEAQKMTAAALAELAANPAFAQWQAQQQANGSSHGRGASKFSGKAVFSRLGDAVASMSPSKWRPTRIRVSQIAGKGATPDRNAPPTPTTPSAMNPQSRVFTSPRQRVIRIASPIQNAVDQEIVTELLQHGGSSPNSKRRLAFEDTSLF